MDPLNAALNEIQMKDRQIAELQGLLDRQAATIHKLQHDHRVVLEGAAARAKFALERHDNVRQLVRELVEALQKELVDGR